MPSQVAYEMEQEDVERYWDAQNVFQMAVSSMLASLPGEVREALIRGLQQ
jgi:hypothetical protein